MPPPTFTLAQDPPAYSRPVSTYLSKEQDIRLDNTVVKAGISKANFVRQAIQFALDHMEPE